jgi:hypothetical protein
LSKLIKLGCVNLLLINLVVAQSNVSTFQDFDNQYNLGFSYAQGGLINGHYQLSNYTEQALNLEVERLFDNKIWFDTNFNMVTAYNQPNLGNLNGGDNSGIPFGQNPFYFGLKFKTGYAFEVVENHLLLTPYVLFGGTTNWATSSVIASGSKNLTALYFYTGGLGARVSYRINSAILLYFDQAYVYNWDNSGAIKEIQSDPRFYGKSYAATNYMFNSTLGSRFNLYKNLQLGLNGFYSNFQPQSNVAASVYLPTNSYGVMASIGLTY